MSFPEVPANESAVAGDGVLPMSPDAAVGIISVTGGGGCSFDRLLSAVATSASTRTAATLPPAITKRRADVVFGSTSPASSSAATLASASAWLGGVERLRNSNGGAATTGADTGVCTGVDVGVDTGANVRGVTGRVKRMVSLVTGVRDRPCLNRT